METQNGQLKSNGEESNSDKEGQDHELEPLTSGINDVPKSPENSSLTKIEEMEEDIADFIPTPPDGGWGWVIVLSSFMNHFILDGISYAFGAFMKDYSEYFKSSSAATSALMSTLIGCYMLSAPVASALVNKFGCRPVGIAGSLLASFAFIICTFSTSIEVMIFTFGVLGGIGFGFMYLPAVVSVSLYFEKKRAIAIGIAMCGTGVGTFAFGPTATYLLEIMDWKGAHYILAGIILNGVVFSALIRPLTTVHDRKVAVTKKVDDKTLKSRTSLVQASKSGKSLVTDRQESVRSQPSEFIGSHVNVGSVNIYRSSNKLGSVKKVATNLTVEEATDLKRPMYRKDIFYSGSIYNLNEYKGATNVKDYVASITSLPTMQESPVHLPNSRPLFCRCLPRQLADVLAEMLDFSLFKSMGFNIICFVCLLIMLAYFIPFAYTSVRAEEIGVDGDPSFLISILGLSTMVGRLAACAIAQIPNLKALIVHNIFLTLAGVACLVVPFCRTYTTMAIAAFAYGMFMGGHVSLSPIVLVDILGLDKLTTAYGLLTLVRGISTLAGPPIAGSMHDHFHSYDISFYMAGGLIIFGTLGFCLLQLQCVKGKEADSKSSSA